MTDARTIWDQREAKDREQEAAVVAVVKKHNAKAREDRITGEVVIRLVYKEGGVIKKRVEVHTEER